MARKRISDFYHRSGERSIKSRDDTSEFPTIASRYYIARSKSDRVKRDATNLACVRVQNSRKSRVCSSSLKIDEFTVARTFHALVRFICSDIEMRETSTELNEITARAEEGGKEGDA